MTTQNPRLAALFAQLHTAIISKPAPASNGAPEPTTAPPELPVLPVRADEPPPAPEASSWPTESPAQLSAAEYQANPPKPRVLASYPTAEEVRRGLQMSKGARRFHDLLHDYATAAGRERGYTVTPRQVVIHLPAVSAAGVLDYHPDHLTRLGRELERLGLLDCGGHAQRVRGRSMYDGTLWAVLMVPGGEAPRIRAEEWRHNWRPTFEADVEGKTGAAREMSELRQAGADEEQKYQAARARAVNPGVVGYIHPPLPSSDNCSHASLKAVVEGLSQLWHLHPSKRPRAVGLLASQIARALSEPERRRYWCRVIWQALKAQGEMRGGLQTLGAQLSRLEADLREGAPWRNPGAVLAARLKAA